MHITQLLKRAFISVGFLALGACSQSLPEGKYCTLIGCQSGLFVSFKADAPATFKLKLTAKDGKVVEGSCPSNGSTAFQCFPNSVSTPEFTPEQLSLELTVGEQMLVKSFTPAYKNNQPNGPDCEPTCKQATIELDLTELKPKAN
jgi:hypothetical protein